MKKIFKEPIIEKIAWSADISLYTSSPLIDDGGTWTSEVFL